MSSAVGKKDEATASGGRLVFVGSGVMCRVVAWYFTERRDFTSTSSGTKTKTKTKTNGR